MILANMNWLNFQYKYVIASLEGLTCGSVVKNLPAFAGAAGDTDSIPEPGRSPGGGNGTTPVFLP